MRRFFAWKWQIAGMPFSWPKALEACCRMSWVRGKSGHGANDLAHFKDDCFKRGFVSIQVLPCRPSRLLDRSVSVPAELWSEDDACSSPERGAALERVKGPKPKAVSFSLISPGAVQKIGGRWQC